MTLKRGHLPGTVLAVGLATLAFVSCSSKSSSAPAGGAFGPGGRSRAITVQAVTVQFSPLVVDQTTAGTIVPVTQSNVAAQVSGVVASVYHSAGEWVKAGEAVAQLDDSQLKLSLQSAQANLLSAQVNVSKSKTQLDLANLTLQRDQQLMKQNLITQSQLDNDQSSATVAEQGYQAALAAVQLAQAQLEQAQLNIGFAAIKAPFGGQLAAVNVTPGEFVGQNTVAFVLVSAQKEINFNVPPTDAPSLPLGHSVEFTTNGRTYPARVSQAPSAPIGGVVPMVALFDTDVDPDYGTVGTVAYRLTIANGVLVPIDSLQTTGNQNFVYVVESGKAVTKNITIVAESGSQAVVTGIGAGMQVILSPPPGLLNGVAVQIVGAQGGAAAATGAAGQSTAGAPANRTQGARPAAPSGASQGGGSQ